MTKIIRVFLLMVLTGVSCSSVNAMTLVAKAEEKPGLWGRYETMINGFWDRFYGLVSEEAREKYRQEQKEKALVLQRQREYHERPRRLNTVTWYLIHKFYDKAIQEIEKPVLVSLASKELLRRSARDGGQIRVIKKVLDLGVEGGYWISDALRYAAIKGYWDAAFFLYEVLQNHDDYKRDDYQIGADLLGAFAEAAYKGYIPLMRTLMQDPYVRRGWYKEKCFSRAWVPDDRTALHVAIQGNQIGVVNFLLKQGAKQGIKNQRDETEIQKANGLGFVRIAEILTRLQEELDIVAQENRAEGADTQGQRDTSPKSLIRLINEQPTNEGNRKIIHDRIMNDSALTSPLLVDALGNTILHRAAKIADWSLFRRIMLLNSLLIDVRNKRGETPLYVAVEMGGRQILEIFNQNTV